MKRQGRVPHSAPVVEVPVRSPVPEAGPCVRRFDVNVTPDKRKMFLHAEKAMLQAFQQVRSLRD